tara:strand:+ start:25189 stop:25716 length:528 start_codon:yes stop_codon:yes gene_type:complete
MNEPYEDAYTAIRRAYSMPRAQASSLNLQRKERGHDDLDRMEMIAQDAMVRVMAEQHCGKLSQASWVVLWSDDPELMIVALKQFQAAFAKPGRTAPLGWVADISQQWANRKDRTARITAAPTRSDTEWGGILGIDRRTAGAWRRELQEQLHTANRSGLQTAGYILKSRGLIPGEL